MFIFIEQMGLIAFSSDDIWMHMKGLQGHLAEY